MERHLLITLEESKILGTQGVTVRTTEGAGNVLVQVPDNTTVVSIDEMIEALTEIKAFADKVAGPKPIARFFIPAGTDVRSMPGSSIAVEREVSFGEVPDLEFDEQGNVKVK